MIRDIFITNILDDDIQHKLLRDTVEPEPALRFTVNKQRGHQNQQRISSINNGVTAIQQFTRFCGANTRAQQHNRTTFNPEANGLCRNCGQKYTSTPSSLPRFGYER